jgi:hypothetical protein
MWYLIFVIDIIMSNFPFQAKRITEAESKYKSLLELLDPKLSLSYQKRCAEATEEGSLLEPVKAFR